MVQGYWWTFSGLDDATGLLMYLHMQVITRETVYGRNLGEEVAHS